MFQKQKEKKLHELQQREATADLRQLVTSLPDAQGVISLDNFRRFLEFTSGRDIEIPEDVMRTVLVGAAQGGVFVEADTSLLLKKDEASLLDVAADLLKEVADREFRGGSQGVSIPIGGGMRYRVGQYRGHMETIGHHWTTADSGRLTITDKRIVYHGGRKTLEFPYAKMATLNAYTDAIDLGVTSRQMTSSFAIRDPELVAGIIHAAIAHSNGDIAVVKLQFTG